MGDAVVGRGGGGVDGAGGVAATGSGLGGVVVWCCDGVG